jgi:hypothetical protein
MSFHPVIDRPSEDQSQSLHEKMAKLHGETRRHFGAIIEAQI